MLPVTPGVGNGDQMPQASGGGRSEGEPAPSGDEELSEESPPELIRGQIIPPAPNRWESAIDWLQDFGGFSWIAYGASSVLVISHCPSPTSREQTLIEPFFKQVIEPSLGLPSRAASRDGSPVVKAVAWCHSQPSDGVVAAGLGDSVFVYYPDVSYGRGKPRSSRYVHVTFDFLSGQSLFSIEHF